MTVLLSEKNKAVPTHALLSSLPKTVLQVMEVGRLVG